MLSLIGVPLGVVTPNATDSAPCSRRYMSSFDAISSSASSQLMHTQPGSSAPFRHIAWPVGCSRSGRTVNWSLRTTLIVPQRERQSVQ